MNTPETLGTKGFGGNVSRYPAKLDESPSPGTDVALETVAELIVQQMYSEVAERQSTRHSVTAVAALIRQAIADETRELRETLQRAYQLAHIFEKKVAFLALSDKSHDEYLSAMKELAEAERLLSKGQP
jgi:hypothetical protein